MKKVLLYFFLFILLIISVNILDYDTSKNNDTIEFTELKLLAKNITLEIKEFYNYNLSNIKVPYNESYLREYGGVCWHYSEFAYRIGMENIESGIFTQKVIIDTNKTRRHQFTTISNKGGYCIIEQTRYFCFPLLI